MQKRPRYRLRLGLGLGLFLIAALGVTTCGSEVSESSAGEVLDCEVLEHELRYSHKNESVSAWLTVKPSGRESGGLYVGFEDSRDASRFRVVHPPGSSVPCRVKSASQYTLAKTPYGDWTGLMVWLLVALFALSVLWRNTRGWARARRSSATALSHQRDLYEKRPMPFWGLVVLVLWLGAAALPLSGAGLIRGALDYQWSRDDWVEVDAMILESWMEVTQSDDGTSYTLHVTYRYELDDVRYFSDDARYSSHPSSEDVIERFNEDHPEGEATTCFVDPDDPSNAVLEHAFPTAQLYGGLVMVISGLALMWIMWRLGAVGWAARQLKRRREPEGNVEGDGGSFDVSRFATGDVPATGLLQVSEGSLTWTLDVLRLEDDRGQREITWEESTLHLSRSAGPPLPPDVPAPERDAHWLHFELRSQRARIALSAPVTTQAGIARLAGLPWLHRPGLELSAEELERWIPMALERGAELAAWPPEAAQAPEHIKRRSLKPRVLFDTTRDARQAVELITPFFLISAALVAMTWTAHSQPYPGEGTVLEKVFGGILSLTTLGLLYAVLRQVRRLSTGVVARLSTEPAVGEQLMGSVAVRGAERMRKATVTMQCEDTKTVSSGDSSTVVRADLLPPMKQTLGEQGEVTDEEAFALTLPDSGHPSLKLSKLPNRVEWKLTVEGDVGFKLTRTMTLEVGPMPPSGLARYSAQRRSEVSAPHTVRDEGLQCRVEGWSEVYAPLDVVHGTVLWKLSEGVERAELALLWVARNGLEEDSPIGSLEVVAVERFEDVRPDTPHRFAFKLPEKPYSLHGNYVSVAWMLELVVLPVDRVLRIPLEVHPTREGSSMESSRKNFQNLGV